MAFCTGLKNIEGGVLKSRIRETQNLLTNAASSTNNKKKVFFVGVQLIFCLGSPTFFWGEGSTFLWSIKKIPHTGHKASLDRCG